MTKPHRRGGIGWQWQTSRSFPEGLKDFALNGKAALVIGAENEAWPRRCDHACRGRGAGADRVAGRRYRKRAQGSCQGDRSHRVQGIDPGAARGVTRLITSASVDLAVTKFGGLDILVTALDSPFYGPAETADDSAFDRLFENNFKTAWMAFQECWVA